MFLSQLPADSLQPHHFQQMLRLPEYTASPSLTPVDASGDTAELPTRKMSELRMSELPTRQTSELSTCRTMSSTAIDSKAAASSREANVGNPSSEKMSMSSSCLLMSSTASVGAASLGPVPSHYRRMISGGTPKGEESSTRAPLVRHIISPSRPPAVAWTSCNGSDNGGGEPLRGIVFTIDLESIDKCRNRLQTIIWGLRSDSKATTPLASNQTTTRPSPPKRSDTESLFSFPSLWSKLKGKTVSSPIRKAQPQRPPGLVSHSPEHSPIITPTSISPKLPHSYGRIEGPSLVGRFTSDTSTSPFCIPNSSQPPRESGGSTAVDEQRATNEQRSLEEDEKEERISGTEEQNENSPFTKLDSSTPHVHTSPDIYSSRSFSNISNHSNMTLRSVRNDSEITKGRSMTSEKNVSTSPIDPSVFRSPVISTPTLVFVSLQEVTSYNRPLEGCVRIWELLAYKNKLISSLEHQNDNRTPYSNSTDDHSQSTDYKLTDCPKVACHPEPSSTRLAPSTSVKAKADAADRLSDFSDEYSPSPESDRSYSGFRCRKCRSRISPPAALDKFDIDLTLTALHLPEVVPVTRQDGHRMVDKKFPWDDQTPKHAGTITRRRQVFSLSLALWEKCLTGRPKPSRPLSARFIQNLMEVSSTDDGSDLYQLPTTGFTDIQSPTMKGDSQLNSMAKNMKLWHSEPFQDAGKLLSIIYCFFASIVLLFFGVLIFIARQI